MTGKPALTIEELLNRYERYDIRRRARHQPHPSKHGFIFGTGATARRGFAVAESDDELRLGISKQAYYNYEARYNLPWPLLPEDPTALCFVIFGQHPYELTWVSQSVADVLGHERASLVGCPSVSALRRDVPWGEEQAARVRQLKEDPRVQSATIDCTYLVTAAGLYLPIRLGVRYCGKQADRFYFQAVVLGAPTASLRDTDLFNVYPDYVYELKSRPPTRQLTDWEDALITQVTRMRNDPAYMRRVINQAIGTYRPPERGTAD